MKISEKKRPKKPNIETSFLAILPDKDIQDYTRISHKLIAKEARNFNFVPLDRLNILIKYLGEGVSTDSLTQVIETIQQLSSGIKPFELNLLDLKFGLPYQTIPRVLFWEVKYSAELTELCKLIHYQIKKLGLWDIKKEKDFYRNIFHLTTGKVKHPVSRSFGRKIRLLLENNKFQQKEFQVTKIYLIKTIHYPNCIQYKILADFDLKA